MDRGAPCHVSVALEGRDVKSVGDALFLTESVAGGCRLGFETDPEAGSPVAEGSQIDLELGVGENGEDQFATRLFTESLEYDFDDVRGRGSLRVEAVDPLAFLERGAQFRTRPGRVSLGVLLRDLIADTPGDAAGAEIDGGGSRLPHEWLFQCEETDSELLHRICGETDHAVYWNRSRVCVSRSGSKHEPGSAITLDSDEGLLRRRYRLANAMRPRKVRRVDPQSRQVVSHEIRLGTGRPAAGRVASPFDPGAAGLVGPTPTVSLGHSLELETTRPDIELGMSIDVGDGENWVVDRIHHRIDTPGRYWNEVRAVRPAEWGLALSGKPGGLRGPFQARVADNDSGDGTGRLRVILDEDPEQRPSSWLPVPTWSAGAGSGVYWLPERGESVLVVCDSASPERLVCLGAIRSSRTKADGVWRSDRNHHKVLQTPGGSGLQVNDADGSLVLFSRSARLELRGDGTVVLNGASLRAHMDARMELVAEADMKLDATRIDLG